MKKKLSLLMVALVAVAAFAYQTTRRAEAEAIVISPESGDIYEAFATATEGKTVGDVTINLKAGVVYTLKSTIKVPSNLTINGNGATIDASTGDNIIGIDGVTEKAKKADGTDSDYSLVGSFTIKDVTIKGMKKALVRDLMSNKTLLENLTIENCVIEASNAKPFIDFDSRGYVGKVVVKNSTIWAAAGTDKNFAKYGTRPKDINGNLNKEFDVQNSTIVNLGSKADLSNGQNFNNFSQKGTANNIYTLKNNIFVNCGKSKQTVIGFNGGQASATPVWDVDGNLFNWNGVDTGTTGAENEVTKAGQKGGEDIVKHSVAGVVAFADAANGDFTLEYGSAANTAKVGDPRWIQYGITIAEGIENGTVSTSPATSAVAGAEVTITTTPKTGYELKAYTLKVTYMDGETEKNVEVKDNKFTMPATAVTVKAEFWLIPEDITVNMDAAGNINEALTAAIGTKNPKDITINLAAGGAYTVNASIVAPNNLTLKGDATNPATITVAEEMTADIITLNGTNLLAVKKDGTLSDHQQIAAVEISGVKILGNKGALITDAQKTLLEKLTISDAVIEMPAAGKNVINFNGKGYVGKVVVNKSTIYANGMNTGFFAQYGSRPKNVNGDWLQEFDVQNSTIVNIANGKNVCDLKQNGTAQNVYTLKNNIFVDCGKKNQVVVGFNKGQASATPVWDVDGNIFNWGGVDVCAAEAAKAIENLPEGTPEIVKNSVAGVVTFSETAGDFNGSFLLAPETTSMPETIGDPRWKLTSVTSYAISVAEGLENGTLAADLPYAAEGTTVVITATPAETYKVKYGTVEATYVEGEETKKATVTFDEKTGKYSFVMPAAAVTLKAQFERVPVDIEVVAADITEGDLTAAIAAKSKAVTDVNDVVGNITITLDGETAYKVTAPIDGAKSVVINGNGAKIDAAALEDAFIKMRETPIIDPNEKGAYLVDNITFNNVKISGLKYQLFYANKQKYLIGKLTVENSVIGIDGTNKKTIFDFKAGGLTEDLTINNSTIWANPTNAVNGGLYSTESGSKIGDLGATKNEITITNSTLYNIANGKPVSTLRQNSQNEQKYTLKNNIIVNCGATSNGLGQFLKGLNARSAGKDKNWDVEGNVINYSKGFMVEEKVGSSEENIKNPIPAIAVFADADNGDFNVSFAKDPKADLVVAGVGDPRWTIGATTDAKSVNVAETIEHATVTVDKAFSLEDEIVTITVVPEAGYSVAKMYAKVGNTPIKVECKEKDKTYTFTMPAMNVTVSADMEIVATDFVINVESGSITEAINNVIKYTEGEEVKTKNIKSLTINLKKAGIYTITESIVSPGYVVINGMKDAIIDASDLKQISGEGEETTTTYLPLIVLDGTTVQAKNADGTENENYKSVEKVVLKDVTITNLANAIVKDAQKTLLDKIEVENSVIELIGKNNVFDFNGKGYPADVTINKSTLWSKEGHTGFFIQTSGRVKDLDNAQTTYKQILTITNSTLSQIAVGKKMNNYQGKGQKSLVFTLTNNILNNVGSSEGNEINGFLGGQNSNNPTVTYENNTYWSAKGNVAGWTDATKQGSDQSGTALLFNPYLKDAANGDFAVGYKTEQAEKKTGDQRWGTWENTVFTITVAEMEGGTIVAPATAEAEDEIQLIAKPAEGFRLKAGSVYGMMGKSVFEISDELTFYMPVTDVTIYAEFEPVYAVNIAEGIENGTVKADVTEAGAGDIVTLTITPAEGYELDAITVRGVTSDIAVEVVDGKFTMPADAVTVNATFKSTTGINSVKADALENAVIYNMQGVRVEKAQAKGGVFIVNGKKVAIK